MRIVRHTDYVKQQKRRAIILAAVGFVALFGAMFAGYRPQFLLFAYVAMILGFVAFNIGMQGVGKWNREKRNDELLDARLVGLNDRYTLIHYEQLGKQVVEHMLVFAGGVLVMAARELDGEVIQRKASWRRGGGMFRRIFQFSGPQLSNPSFELDKSIAAVEERLSAEGIEAGVRGAVVFLHPKVQLDIQQPDYPVLMGDELPSYIHDLRPVQPLSDDTQKRMVAALSSVDAEAPVVKSGGTASASARKRPVRRANVPPKPAPTATKKSKLR